MCCSSNTKHNQTTNTISHKQIHVQVNADSEQKQHQSWACQPGPAAPRTTTTRKARVGKFHMPGTGSVMEVRRASTAARAIVRLEVALRTSSRAALLLEQQCHSRCTTHACHSRMPTLAPLTTKTSLHPHKTCATEVLARPAAFSMERIICLHQARPATSTAIMPSCLPPIPSFPHPPYPPPPASQGQA